MTPKQERFVAEYLQDLNATQAAIRAGYSPKTATQQAARLLTNVNVQAAVSSAKDRQLKSADLSATRILEEMRRVALSDPRDVLTGEDVKPPGEWSEDVARAIASVKTKRVNMGDAVVADIIEVKFWNKVAALDQLGKHFGILKEQIEITGSADLIERLAAGRRRLSEEEK